MFDNSDLGRAAGDAEKYLNEGKAVGNEILGQINQHKEQLRVEDTFDNIMRRYSAIPEIGDETNNVMIITVGISLSVHAKMSTKNIPDEDMPMVQKLMLHIQRRVNELDELAKEHGWHAQ